MASGDGCVVRVRLKPRPGAQVLRITAERTPQQIPVGVAVTMAVALAVVVAAAVVADVKSWADLAQPFSIALPEGIKKTHFQKQPYGFPKSEEMQELDTF